MQCVSGPVIGNYSGTGALNLPLAAANPPYKQPVSNTTSGYPVDDKNRTFGGNSGDAQQLLNVQCSNPASNVSPAAGVMHTRYVLIADHQCHGIP